VIVGIEKRELDERLTVMQQAKSAALTQTGAWPMAYAFDTLGYAKRLRDAGISMPEAEAHAEAAREFIMVELVTKSDLASVLEHQTLRLTVRLGGMVAIAVAVLAIIIKL
jgi:hypothetical protein